MKILFLHIGTQKTATSSIQRFCVMNREVLQNKGYCYPESVRHYPDANIDRNAHFMVGDIKDSHGKRIPSEEQHVFKLGMDNVHKYFQEYDHVILSDESLWWDGGRSRKNLWHDLKDDAEKHDYIIKLIVYLRRQDEFLTSRWKQKIKTSTIHQTWDDHIKTAPDELAYALEYASRINGLAEIFGKENIIVRRYDFGSFYGGSIYADFLHSVGLELTDDFKELKTDRNLSLKGNTVEIMRVMNTTSVVNRKNNLYWRRLVKMCSEESDKYYQYNMFSKDEAAEFLERYHKGNEQIADDYIGDGSPLFHYDVKDLQKWEKNNEYMIDDVIRVFTVITNELHSEINELHSEIDKLTAKKNTSLFQKFKRFIRSLLKK